MNELELPEDKMDVAEARISWAASFLTDWLLPLVQENRIKNASEIIRLREEFPPRDRNGTDFTIHDVLMTALRWREHNIQHHPHTPEDKLPNGKALHRAIDLLDKAVQDDPPEESTQTTFPTDGN